MPDRNFWESLGRGVGYGWKKAKELGESLAERAEESVDVRAAREGLAKAEHRLGALVAERRRQGARSLDLEGDEALREAIGAAETAREELARREAELAEQQRAQGTGESAPGGEDAPSSPEPGPATGQEGSGAPEGERSPEENPPGGSAPPSS